MWSDLRLAFRHHRTRPAFASTVVATLALTIGAAVAVFAVVNAVLVRALPFDAPERLVWIASVRPDSPSAPFSLPEYLDYRRETRALSGLAAYGYWSASLAGDGVTERLQGARMSGNTFEVLGISPAAGRLLTDADDRADAPPVVVISHRLWRRLYDGNPAIGGTPVRINGESFVIAGVLPAQFALPLRDIDVVTPLAPDRDPLRHLRNSTNFLRLFGRVRPGIDVGQVTLELTEICRSLRERFPVEYARKEAVRVDALHAAVVGDVRPILLALLAAVSIVLAAALANLTSLTVVQGAARRPELAMRVALGASPPRLARQLFAESVVLTGAGALLGWGLAGILVLAAVRWAPPSAPRLTEINLDGGVAMLLAALTLTVALLLALAPLGAAALARGSDLFRSSSRGVIGRRRDRRIRHLLVVAQVGAALALMLATAAITRHLTRLQQQQPGFNPEGVFQARVSIPSSHRSPDDVVRFYERLAGRITAVPGVTHVGVISIAPLSGLLRTVPFAVEGQPVPEGERLRANLRAVSPGYFPAVETRLRRGRMFSENDRWDTPHVALISAALADRVSGDGAVGLRLLVNDNNQGPRPIDIVGVVDNVRHSALDVAAELDIYLPLRQVHPDESALIRNTQFWMVRTGTDPAAFRQAFLMHVREVDRDAAVSDAGAMQQAIDAWLGPRRFTLALFGAFASVTTAIAIVGVYGLASYAASQRTPEIGLRMALGATARDVRWLIARDAAQVGVLGALAGCALIIALRPAVTRFVAAIELTIPIILASVATLMAVILLAAWFPAHRAAGTRPTDALRM